MEVCSPITPKETTPLLENTSPQKRGYRLVNWLNKHDNLLFAIMIISASCLVGSLTFMFLTPVALIPIIPFMATIITTSLCSGISFTAFLFIDPALNSYRKEQKTPPPTSYNAKIDFEGFDLSF